MSLQVGSRLGHYTVDALIGEGGMGQVYQATDAKLGRRVALKILPEPFASDPDRLARFQREAQVLASLNHPGIAAIYGLEEAKRTKALVLELVEGPTLADRIKQGPIPVDEALPIARQIAEALEAAHEAGVIHRDLKPANIKVRDDGTVKVLDFGLAKAFQPDASDPNMSQSPTISLTAAATQMGMVIGTAAYMAPEQARGKVVDKRADIFAFGVVLYEMLTGQRPFQGEDVSLTLAAVMTYHPDLDRLPETLSPTLKTYLIRCLAKDRKQRVHDIADVRLALEGAFDPTAGVTVDSRGGLRVHAWQRPAGVLLLVVLTAFVAGFSGWVMTRQEPAPAADVMRFEIVPSPSTPYQVIGNRAPLAISADGTMVAYTGPAPGEGRTRLSLRPLAQVDGEPLGGGEDGLGPFFSPAGESVGFVDNTGRMLLRVSVFGGPPETLAESPSAIYGASWGGDDEIVFGTRGAGLFRVSARGGQPEVLTELDTDEGETDHLWPSVITGRAAVVFVIGHGASALDTGQLAVLDLDTRAVTRLRLAGVSPRYLSTGHLVYAASDGSVRAVTFDVTSLEVTGNPVPVIDRVGVRPGGAAAFDVSDNGRLVYAVGGRGNGESTLVWVDRDGGEEPVGGLPLDFYNSVAISPDGSSLALDIGEVDDTDVWTYDLERGVMNPIATEPGREETPIWTPDGSHVVFGAYRDGSRSLYRRNADGTGDVTQLLAGDDLGGLVANGWSPSGDTLLVMTRRERRNDLLLLSMEDGAVTELPLEAEYSETRAGISTDGQWIAYESDRSGEIDIWVERFPGLGERQRVSAGGGQQPRWSPDGQELFYLSSPEPDRLMAIPVTTGPVFGYGTPEVVFDGRLVEQGGRTSYDIASDGKIVAIKVVDPDGVSSSPRINVVLNWTEEVQRLVPVD